MNYLLNFPQKINLISAYINTLKNQSNKYITMLLMGLYFVAWITCVCFYSFMVIYRERGKSFLPDSLRNPVVMEKWFWKKGHGNRLEVFYSIWGRQRFRSLYLLLYLCFLWFSCFLKLLFLVSCVLPKVSSMIFALSTDGLGNKFMWHYFLSKNI